MSPSAVVGSSALRRGPGCCSGLHWMEYKTGEGELHDLGNRVARAVNSRRHEGPPLSRVLEASFLEPGKT
jgi:hypothetical protein